MKYHLEENPDVDVLEEEEIDAEELLSLENHIVIWNDDVNTFDWVISTLIDVCDHQLEQAQQCANIIHNNGKCSVKRGSFKKLKPLLEAILERKISATIE